MSMPLLRLPSRRGRLGLAAMIESMCGLASAARTAPPPRKAGGGLQRALACRLSARLD